MKKAFTLIELLIVVAIIAILAAIAVPNFLEAQTRSKVSRVKADVRSISTAIEAYVVDNNHYPFDYAEDVLYPYYLGVGITTPVAYMTNAARMYDVFAVNPRQGTQNNPNSILFRYRYRAFTEKHLLTPPGPFNIPGCDPASVGSMAAKQVFGAWFIVSKGPDGRLNLPQTPSLFADGNNATDWFWQLYDPTNGTISRGDVIRGQSGDMSGRMYPDPAPTYN